MESLRWILLAVGVVLVVGIYFWSRRDSERRIEPRFEPDAGPEAGEPDADDWEVRPVDNALDGEPRQEELPDLDDIQMTPVAEPVEIDTALAAQLKGLEQALGREHDESPGEARPASAGAEAAEEKIIVFYLVASKGSPFQGGQVAQAFASEQLRYGEMSIFHRMTDEAGQAPVFSVANLVEPGTFDPATIADSVTPGLSLFMRLPGPTEPLRAFEDLAQTAQSLARQLRGELRDDQRSLVTAQTLAAIRADVADFERRLQIASGS